MAIRVSVFAGLGSPALFSSSTQATAVADAALPEAQALLNACHKIFLTEFSPNSNKHGNVGLAVAVKDFPNPQDLLVPPERYHKNAVVQNTTLCLVQMLRYLAYSVKHADGDVRWASGTAGVCSGLLTATTVAACSDMVTFLSHGQKSFHLALLLGRRIEEHVKHVLWSTGSNRELPWSVIIDGLTRHQAEELIAKHKQANSGTHIYVSAKSTEKCLTLSGRGDQLRTFVQSTLPKNCRSRPTNLYSPYHDRHTLVSVKAQVLSDAAERGLTYPSLAELKVPIYMGEPVPSSMNPATMQQSMLHMIVDRILTSPVDWLSAQEQIFTDPAIARADGTLNREVLNFGPGYGVVKSEAQRRSNVRVLDVSYEANNDGGLEAPPTSSDGDIAIIGMAVDLPGAPDSESLWKVLMDEINTVEQIPESRFHVEDFYTSSKDKANKPKRSLGTKFGNFMDDPFRFDHAFFGVSPREAKSVDPQQRVLLQTTYKALEDAGYIPDSTPSFARDTFGCYIGNATLDYPDNLKDEIDVYYSPGTLRAFLSGRVSYVFGFSGPCMTIDTACSSSMVSIFHACRALVAGDCRAAVAGGVNVITSPDMYLGLDRAHFLSPTGQCKAFDASADGYCRSEGCGIFVLKRLSDAVNDSDNILGVIKGVEINQSGNADSITHPHAPTQEQLFQKLFAKADIDPLRVSVVEAHGTGTQAGDPQEATSIRNVLSKDRDESNPLYLTSIKANIGHCEAASGAAALAKLLLMTEHASIPKQVSLKNLNPRIKPLGVDGTMIARDQTEWTSAAGQPRIAMLNNFGAAGSNGALLLQEAPQHSRSSTSTKLEQRRTHMFGFSAKSASSLSAYQKVLIPFLKENADTLDLCDICYTGTARRQIYNFRTAVHASSVLELAEKLEKAEHAEAKKDIVPRVIFVFSGQGSQYISMGHELFTTSEIFRETVLDCESWLQNEGFPSCLRIINYDNEAGDDLKAEEELQAMQTAIFVVEVGLARMWCSWGVQPTMVTGHSIGQYAALVIAGTLELIDALKIVASRARLMIEKCPRATTGMLAVNQSTSDIERYISSSSTYKDLSIACCNSPHDCVVGGPLGPLEKLRIDLKENHKFKAAMLGNPMAYHTKAMEPVLAGLTSIAASVKWSPPQIPVICNVLGRVVEQNETTFNQDFPSRHCRQTVKFEQGIEDALSGYFGEGVEPITWIEIGPHPSIIPMIKSQVSNKDQAFIPSMRKSTAPWETLCEAQCQLYRSNVPVNWLSAFSEPLTPKCISIPSYQFDYSKFVVEYPHEDAKDLAATQPPSTGYDFLSCQKEHTSSSGSKEMVFETPTEKLAEYITGHMVCDFALCPASVYHEMALAAAEIFDKHELSESDASTPSTNTLTQISYLNPLIYVEGAARNIRISIRLMDGKPEVTKSFTVSSYDSSNSKKITHHCQGHVKRQSLPAIEAKFSMLHAQLQKPVSVFDDAESMEVFRTRAIYEKLFPRVVTYSKMYQAVQSMSISADGAEALATVRLPGTSALSEKFAVNPIFMDVILHVAGFVANLAAEDADAFICKEVKSARVIMAPTDLQQSIQVYCSNVTVAEGNSTIGNGYAMGPEGRLLAVFKGMHFTRVKLSKIAAGFRHASGKADQKPAKAKVGAVKGETKGINQKSTGPTASPFDHSARSLPTIDAKQIVAEVCGVDATTISSDSELEGLGIDSLMIHELGSRIQEAADATFSNDELTACSTVKDIETLLASKSEIPPEKKASRAPSESPVLGHSSKVSQQVDTASSSGPSAIPIIVEICGAEASNINAQTELESLGIDSLMIFELEDKLKETISADLDGAALGSCKTVGDIDDLLRKTTGIEEEPQPSQAKEQVARPRLQSYSSSSSGSSMATSQLASPPSTQLSTPPTRTSSTSPRPGVDPVMLQKRLPKVLESELSHESPTRPSCDSPQPETQKNFLNGPPKHLGLEDPLTLIQPGKTGSLSQPLVLIHDGSGVSLKYRNIQQLNRQLFGMSNPKAFSTDTWPDLATMAQSYATKISTTIDGPVILGGWSFGGVIAFHAAHLLLKEKYPISGVLLIDSPAPLNHQPLPRAIIDAVSKTSKSTTATNVLNVAVARQFELNTALLQKFSPSSRGPFPELLLLRSREGYDARAKGLECERHEWLEDRGDVRGAVDGWEKIVGREVRVVDIPGNHFEPFEGANVEAVTKAIDQACGILEEKAKGIWVKGV